MIFHLKTIIISLILILTFGTLFAQDYSFDFEEFEKKPYEFVGNIKLQTDLSKLNDSSAFYKLSSYRVKEKDFIDSYLASIQLKASYEIHKFKFTVDLKNNLIFNANDEFENDLNVYEAFMNFTYSTNFDLQIGKKSVKWGKGYIWNPVSFAGRQKDVNDVDAGLEGFWMLKLNYVKSFSGILNNIAINPVILPVARNINEDFSETRTLYFILNNYFLFADTDINSYIMCENTKITKFGLDFARNILTNWEIHAEYTYEKDIVQKVLNSDFNIVSDKNNVHNYILGTRFLLTTNTTIIAEYFHNDSGMSKGQISDFFKAADHALSENQELLPSIKKYQAKNLSDQFLMRDYIYFKVSQPEPFNVLYFTPSVFVLHNVSDNSNTIGTEFSYSRIDNLNLKLKYNMLKGDNKTEFGEKINSDRFSIQVDYTF